MKKLLVGLLCLFSLTSSTISLAEVDASGYDTGSKPITALLSKANNKMAFSPTDIIIHNAAPRKFYFNVYGGKDVMVSPGEWGFITNEFLHKDVRVQIRDKSFHVFWDHTVCSRAVIVVKEYSERDVSVSSEFCH